MATAGAYAFPLSPYSAPRNAARQIPRDAARDAAADAAARGSGERGSKPRAHAPPPPRASPEPPPTHAFAGRAQTARTRPPVPTRKPPLPRTPTASRNPPTRTADARATSTASPPAVGAGRRLQQPAWQSDTRVPAAALRGPQAWERGGEETDDDGWSQHAQRSSASAARSPRISSRFAQVADASAPSPRPAWAQPARNPAAGAYADVSGGTGVPTAVLHFASAAERYAQVLGDATPQLLAERREAGEPPRPHGPAASAAAERALAAAERARQAYTIAVGALGSADGAADQPTHAPGASWHAPAAGTPQSRLGASIGASAAAKFATASHSRAPVSPAVTERLSCGYGGGGSTPSRLSVGGCGFGATPASSPGGSHRTPARSGKDTFSAVSGV
jgi:hypothetical protein